MRRLCSRPACSLVATAVFGFDPDEQIVWLGPLDAPKRVGDLCDRHARAMAPPHGWTLDDRRPEKPAPAPSPGTAEPGVPSAPRRPKGVPGRERPARVRHDVPLPFDAGGEDGAGQAGAAAAPAAPDRDAPSDVPPEGVASWTPRFDPSDDLDGLLDAKTPLLSRAFRNDPAL